METPDPPSDTPGASKQAVLTPYGMEPKWTYGMKPKWTYAFREPVMNDTTPISSPEMMTIDS